MSLKLEHYGQDNHTRNRDIMPSWESNVEQTEYIQEETDLDDIIQGDAIIEEYLGRKARSNLIDQGFMRVNSTCKIFIEDDRLGFSIVDGDYYTGWFRIMNNNRNIGGSTMFWLGYDKIPEGIMKTNYLTIEWDPETITDIQLNCK